MSDYKTKLSGQKRYRRIPLWAKLFFFITPLVFIFAYFASDTEIPRNLRESWHNKNHIILLKNIISNFSVATVKNLLYAQPVKRESAVPSYNLIVPKNKLDLIQTAIADCLYLDEPDPRSTKPYFSALLEDEENLRECKVRLRGYDPRHHRPEKPSLRIKIKKKHISHGQRYLELSRPEDVLALKNWIPDFLGRKIGLITENIHHVRLFINKKYYGLYLKTMRQGEPLAIQHNRMPGTFIKGERYLEKKWKSSEMWNLEGEHLELHRSIFDDFLRIVQESPTADSLNRLSRILDLDAYAKWSALMIVTGSVHTDINHNQSYFFDANRGLLEPVVWDSNSYGIHYDPYLPPDATLHPVQEMLLSHPFWRYQRNCYIHQFLKTHAHPENMLPLIDQKYSQLAPDLKSDTNLRELKIKRNELSNFNLYPVTDIEKKLEEIKLYAVERYQFLRKYLSYVAFSLNPHPKNPNWSAIKLFGTSAVSVFSKNKSTPIQILYPGLSGEEYRFGKRYFETFLKPATMTYTIKQPPETLTFKNAVMGEDIQPLKNFHHNYQKARTIYPSEFPHENNQDITLGPGVISLEESLHTAKNQTLTIQPGTTLLLAPGVGIYARGPTYVNGEKGKPVTIKAKKTDAPWAAFGVFGPHTKGSSFKYMKVSGGSRGQDQYLLYKGMFNVYYCPDVSIENCTFKENKLSDDTTNLSESHVTIKSSVWENGRADGLDLDICTGTINDSQFLNCGNDGLDLMSSQVTVTHCHFKNNQDKGISVGEASRAHIKNCLLESNVIGVESKDNSRALIEETHFKANKTALHNYQKKWSYGKGGSTALVNCHLESSQLADASIEKKSSLDLVNTKINSIDQGEKRIKHVESLSPEWNSLRLTIR